MLTIMAIIVGFANVATDWYVLTQKNPSNINRRGFSVPSAGVEPAHPKILVFETNASTNSASWACCILV